MAAPKRNPTQRAKDLETTGELHLKGWSQTKIAEYLELNQSQVSRDLKKLREIWKTKAAYDFDLYVQQELLRLSMLESEYWDAWARSQTNKEATLQEKLADIADGFALETDASGEARVRASRRVETRIGDPRFLEGLLKVSDQRSKLLGLFPKEVPPSSATSPADVLELYLSKAQASASPNTFNPLDALP